MDSRVGFFAAGIASGALALGAYLAYTKQFQWQDSSSREEGSGPAHHNRDPAAKPGVEDFLEDEILSEQFTRNVQFFGKQGQKAIHDAFVIVVGLGGVGSHAAHMLLRAGVGRLRIIDFDQVSLSSLNRHAVATRADVGLPKAKVLKNHFAEIVPEADVDARVAMYSEAEEERLLGDHPSFVIDAIDDIDTKIALLVACKRRNLPVLCACGAGAKADPSKVRIADLSEASCDPLARKVRYRLRHEHGVVSGLPMVLSNEKPRCNLIPVNELTHDPYELQIIPNFRIRTVPVLGTTPAIFGMTAASWVLCQLAQKPYIPEPIFRVKSSEYQHLLSRLVDREELVFANKQGVNLDLEELVFLVKNIWRVKSARADVKQTTGEKGLTRYLGDLQFTRWDRGKDAIPENLILLTGAEAEAHDATDLAVLGKEEPEFVQRIERVLQSAAFAFGMTE